MHLRLLALLPLVTALALTACAPIAQDSPAKASGPAVQAPTLIEEQKGSPNLDAQWEGYGYTVVESGVLYARMAEKDLYTCGAYGCVGVQIHNVKPCPNMLYVEGNVVSNGIVVDMTNDSLGAVAADTDSMAILEDIRGAGDTIRLSKVSCL